MYDHTLKVLNDFGLSNKEAKVYLGLLELGTATAFEIAGRSEVNRSSTYVVLEALSKRGLVGLSGDKKVRRYTAVSPEAIAQIARAQVKKHDELANNINEILPNLNALNKNIVQKPKVRVFDGLEGLVSALLECLESKEKVLRVFSSGENLMRLVPEYLRLWAKKGAELGIEIRGIYVNCKSTRDMVNICNIPYKVVYVTQKDYPALVDMIIFDAKVGYLIVEGKTITSIFVEAMEIGSVMRGVFDMAFEEAVRRGGEIDQKI